MEFFESEPIFIGDEEAGECMYVRRQGDFKIILVISTYEMYIKVSEGEPSYWMTFRGKEYEALKYLKQSTDSSTSSQKQENITNGN